VIGLKQHELFDPGDKPKALNLLLINTLVYHRFINEKALCIEAQGSFQTDQA